MGDKYMAVSGLPDHCEDHAKCIARLALDMMDMAKNVKMGSNPVVSLPVPLPAPSTEVEHKSNVARSLFTTTLLLVQFSGVQKVCLKRCYYPFDTQ